MKSFKKALQIRARNVKKVSLDKHTLEKTTRDVVSELFGSLGRENVVIRSVDDNKVLLLAQKSIWRAELKLNKKRIEDRIRKIINNPNLRELEIKINSTN